MSSSRGHSQAAQGTGAETRAAACASMPAYDLAMPAPMGAHRQPTTQRGARARLPQAFLC